MANAGEEKREPRRQRAVATVTSLSGAKTIGVTVDRLVEHPLYRKYIRRRTKLAVHDEKGLAKLGDKVEIVACRPISKTKSWRLARVIRPAEPATPAVGG